MIGDMSHFDGTGNEYVSRTEKVFVIAINALLVYVALILRQTHHVFMLVQGMAEPNCHGSDQG